MEFIATILARLDGLFREHGFDIIERDGSYVRLSSDAVEVIIVFNQKERRPYLFIGLGCAIFEMTNDIMAEVLGSDLTIESLPVPEFIKALQTLLSGIGWLLLAGDRVHFNLAGLNFTENQEEQR